MVTSLGDYKEEEILRLVKSNESDRGCKTTPTDKRINKQNKCEINVNISVEKENRTKKGKLVIPFLHVETMGVNGVDMPDSHLFPAVSKRLNALQDHVRNGVIR